MRFPLAGAPDRLRRTIPVPVRIAVPSVRAVSFLLMTGIASWMGADAPALGNASATPARGSTSAAPAAVAIGETPTASTVAATAALLQDADAGVPQTPPGENVRIAALWMSADSLLSKLRADADPSPDAMSDLEQRLSAVRTACGGALAQRVPRSRFAPSDDASFAERLLPEVETALAWCAIRKNDLEAAWTHLEMSRNPTRPPLAWEELRSVLYGNEGGLLLYDGAYECPPVALWITADDARGFDPPARASAAETRTRVLDALRRSSQAVLDAEIDRLAGLVPSFHDSLADLRRVYIAPPRGFEEFPFEVFALEDGHAAVWDRPLSYLPDGSTLEERSKPRLWSGNKLVVCTAPGLTLATLPAELRETAPPRVEESAQSVVRDDAVRHEMVTADQL
ncbi:MAG: hypothetical protein KC729_04620, partial [Candidatus Eisenbacteria bacterium]|nr:hypothetical protein [Candidatus Eisenbacteria bacterium]